MRDLIQAAKNYLQSLEGVTPHTHDQEACRLELRQAIATEEKRELEVKPEGHTSEGWTDDGTGREKPKMTLAEAARQLEARGVDMSAGMVTAPLINDSEAPAISGLALAPVVTESSSFPGKEREMAGVSANTPAPTNQTSEAVPQDAA